MIGDGCIRNSLTSFHPGPLNAGKHVNNLSRLSYTHKANEHLQYSQRSKRNRIIHNSFDV